MYSSSRLETKSIFECDELLNGLFLVWPVLFSIYFLAYEVHQSLTCRKRVKWRGKLGSLKIQMHSSAMFTFSLCRFIQEIKIIELKELAWFIVQSQLNIKVFSFLHVWVKVCPKMTRRSIIFLVKEITIFSPYLHVQSSSYHYCTFSICPFLSTYSLTAMQFWTKWKGEPLSQYLRSCISGLCH